MNYKNNISSKIEKVPRGIQGYGHIIKNVSSKSNVWMDPFKDWLHIWIQQNLIQCVFTNVLKVIMGQNMQVDKENKVSKDALQKSDGQLNRYM